MADKNDSFETNLLDDGLHIPRETGNAPLLSRGIKYSSIGGYLELGAQRVEAPTLAGRKTDRNKSILVVITEFLKQHFFAPYDQLAACLL